MEAEEEWEWVAEEALEIIIRALVVEVEAEADSEVAFEVAVAEAEASIVSTIEDIKKDFILFMYK